MELMLLTQTTNTCHLIDELCQLRTTATRLSHARVHLVTSLAKELMARRRSNRISRASYSTFMSTFAEYGWSD